MYQVLRNPGQNLVDLLINGSEHSGKHLVKCCKNRLVETTVENLEQVIDIHLAKSKTIGCVYFSFIDKHTEKLALICVKRHIKIGDAESEERVNFPSSEFPQIAYPLAVHKKFPHFKKIERYLFETVRSKVNLSQREQVITLIVNEIDKTYQDIQLLINKLYCPVRSSVKDTVTLNADEVVDSSIHLRMGAYWHDNRGVYIVRAGTGIGKTYQALRMFRREKSRGRKTAIISNLISVVKQYKPKDIKAVLYDEDMHEIETADHFSLTINALVNGYHNYKLAQADTIVIDECEKVLQALFDPNVTYIPEFDKKIIRNNLANLLKDKSKKLIFMDADASERVTSAFVHEYRKQDVTSVNFPTTIYKNIEAHVDELELVQSKLIEKKLLSSEKQFIACDSRKMIEHLLKESGYTDSNGYACIQAALKEKILVVHSKVKDFKEQATFLENPNQEISKYRTVIVSPSLREGFDIKAKYCDEVIVLSRNVLQPLQLIQLARRLRKANKILFAVSHQIDMRYDKSKLRYRSQGDDTILEKLKREFEKRETLLKINQPLALTETLEALGFDVTAHPISLVELSNGSKAVTSTAKERLEEIHKARVLSQMEFYQLNSSSALTVADEMAVERWKIADKLNIAVKDVTKEVVQFHEQFELEASQALLRAAQGTTSTDLLASKMAIIVSTLGLNGLSIDDTFEVKDSLEAYENIITQKALLGDCFDKKYAKKLQKMDIVDIKKNAATLRLNTLLKRLGIEKKGGNKGNKNNRRSEYQFSPLAISALLKP